MQRAFRIIRASHRASAWSGEGAAKFGGRWNSVGHPAIYVADSLALASMEVLVHLEAPEILGAFRWAWIELPKRSIATIEPGALPRGWDSSQPPRSIAAFGDAFL